MRRFAVVLSVVVVVLLGMLALHAQPVVVAQEATPSSDMQEPEGVTFEPLAIASGVTLPSPADLIAARFTVDPGAVLPLEASDPTGGMLIVESGTLTIRMDAPWAISRSGSLNAAIATAEATGTFTPSDEQIASGEAATRQPAMPPISRAASAARSAMTEQSRPWRSWCSSGHTEAMTGEPRQPRSRSGTHDTRAGNTPGPRAVHDWFTAAPS